MNIDTKTQLYAIIGDPVEHSKSPAMQNEFFNNAGINAVYLAFHVKGEDLPDVAAGFKKLKELRGFNVTVPHKVEIMKYLDEVDSVAEKMQTKPISKDPSIGVERFTFTIQVEEDTVIVFEPKWGISAAADIAHGSALVLGEELENP
jgi:hypothetical protein